MREQYASFDFTEIQPKHTMSVEATISMFSKFINRNGKLTTQITRKYFIENHLLKEALCNLWFHTIFLKTPTIIERLHCLFNGILSYPLCAKCGKEVTRFYKNFSDGYYNRFCSKSCANSITSSRPCTEEKKDKLRKTHKGRIIFWSEKISKAHKTKETNEKKKATNFKKYGIENPGVLGAYSSRAASAYIKNYLIVNNIPDNRCFYKGGGVNGKEFFQMIYDNKQKKHVYASYDLVIFKNAVSAQDKNLNNIEMVLEYNGPWHYTETEAMYIGDSKATPYPNSSTVREVFEFDFLKEAHMRQYTSKYILY